MSPSLMSRDAGGDLHLKPAAIPLVVALIAIPIVIAMLVGVLTVGGVGPGLAVGAIVVAALIVLAVCAAPRERFEVAAHATGDRRVLVVALTDAGPGAAARVAELAGNAADVRLLVPLRSRRIDRWLSAEDDARAAAERRLAHAAGSMVAAGLPVSGSVGDSDVRQALEDELRSYPADEVILLTGLSDAESLGEAEGRLGLPLRRVVVPAEPAVPG
jgi:hypothetical protein